MPDARLNPPPSLVRAHERRRGSRSRSIGPDAEPVLLQSNSGSLFEPPFETRRGAPRRHHARRRHRVSRPRLQRRRHARHRRRSRPVAGQPVSLLPRQGGAALLLPGPLAGPPARRPRRRTPGRPEGSASTRGTPPRARDRARALSHRWPRSVRRSPRGRRPAAAASRADRRQARSLRARRACPHHNGRRPRRRICRRHTRLSRRAQLDGPLVSPRRRPAVAARRRARRGLCRRWIDLWPHTRTSP
jgi:hypothetical protein